MGRMRRFTGGVLVGMGVLAVLALVVLAILMWFFTPYMSSGKKTSETLSMAAAGLWCAGLVVAGRILRRP